MKDIILKEYLEKKNIFDSYKDRIVNLISDLLNQEKIYIHNIGGRVKTYDSLSNKIDVKLDKYSSLYDITDIIGVRVISYLENTVDDIEKLIRREFSIDDENSIDKRALNTDQFGYKSLHLVVLLNDKRSQLTEYSDYKTLKCEIQIRSILQHTWAEIEHDLGYKGKLDIPDQYKRNFNRLAALLETADVEFVRLKSELLDYQAKVGEQIKTSPQSVLIDQDSLSKFNLENEILIEARRQLNEAFGWTFEQLQYEFSGMPERFYLFNMFTIRDIEISLIENKEPFLAFIIEFAKGFSYDKMPISIALFYFQHFLAAKTQDSDKIIEYLNYSEIKIYDDGETIDRFLKGYQKALE